MSDIRAVHMQQSGPIPGLIGWFSGGQTVIVDYDTMEVVSQEPMAQRAYHAQPLVEPVQSTTPEQEQTAT